MKNFLCAVLILIVSFSLFLPVSAKAPDIESEAAVLIDAKTGQILFDRNMDKKYYPASITKIMTVYLGVSKVSDTSKKVSASEEALDSVPKDTSNIALDYGEEISVEDALYAAQLMSANDASNLIAEAVSGSVSEFVKLMNKTAKNFGTRNTNFKNANGLPDKEHYSTAYDFAVMTMEALKDSRFKKIFCADKYTIGATNKKSEERNFVAQHRMVHWAQYKNLGVKGGKSGYTKESMYTLVTYGVKDGRELICVVLKSPSFSAVYSDTEKLLKHGYNDFSSVTVKGEDISPYEDGLTTYTAHGQCSFLLEKTKDKNTLQTTFAQDKATVTDPDGTVLGEMKATSYTRLSTGQKIIRVVKIAGIVIVSVVVLFYLLLIVSSKNKKRKRKRARVKHYDK